jgi:hypothetical protein
MDEQELTNTTVLLVRAHATVREIQLPMLWVAGVFAAELHGRLNLIGLRSDGGEYCTVGFLTIVGREFLK